MANCDSYRKRMGNREKWGKGQKKTSWTRDRKDKKGTEVLKTVEDDDNMGSKTMGGFTLAVSALARIPVDCNVRWSNCHGDRIRTCESETWLVLRESEFHASSWRWRTPSPTPPMDG